MKAIIDANHLKRIIDNTKYFTGFSSHLMEYIYLEIDAENMTIRATALDGHRVSVEYAKILDADESFKCFIKPILPKITKRTGYATLELTEKRLLVEVEGTITGFVQPEGTYFPVDEMIESETKKEVIKTIGINAKYLKDALNSVNDGADTRKIIQIDVKNANDPLIIKNKGISRIATKSKDYIASNNKM